MNTHHPSAYFYRTRYVRVGTDYLALPPMRQWCEERGYEFRLAMDMHSPNRKEWPYVLQFKEEKHAQHFSLVWL